MRFDGEAIIRLPMIKVIIPGSPGFHKEELLFFEAYSPFCRLPLYLRRHQSHDGK